MAKTRGDVLVITSAESDTEATLVVRNGHDLYGVLNIDGAKLWLASYRTLANYGSVHYLYLPEFDVVTFDDDELAPKLRRYYLDFPIAPHTGDYFDDETGWLSPDGTLYPCPYGQHVNTAGHILASRCGLDSGNDETLEGLGWVRLLRDGSVLWPRVDGRVLKPNPTQRQIDTLFDMLLAAKTDLRRRGLREALSDALGEQFAAAPFAGCAKTTDGADGVCV